MSEKATDVPEPTDEGGDFGENDALAESSASASSEEQGDESESLLGSSFAGRFLKRLPGGNFAEERLEQLESRVFKRLKTRLDAAGEPASMSVLAVSVSRPKSGGTRGGMPGDLLHNLLERSQEPRPKEEATMEYFGILLHQMVPDEARILSALSDGMTYPVIDVLTAGKFSFVARPVVESVSNVGKNAGVQAPGLTPNYVRHLRRLGLVDIVPGESSDQQQYQILETDSEVREAVEAARKHGQRAHIVRRSLKISAVGARLWAACRLSGE